MVFATLVGAERKRSTVAQMYCLTENYRQADRGVLSRENATSLAMDENTWPRVRVNDDCNCTPDRGAGKY